MLSRKKKAFADMFLATDDAKKSALNAGYKNERYGYKLLRDKDILSYIEEYTKNPKIATADEVLSFLTSVMRGEEWEINVTVKKETGEKLLLGEPPTLSQRQKVAELLAKRYRLFSDTHEESENNNEFSVNIKVIN